MLHHYTSRIEKLTPFSKEGALRYTGSGHIKYLYTHRPYLEVYFQKYVNKKTLQKIHNELEKWTQDYERCRDKYGAMQEHCVLKVAEEKKTHYMQLVDKYKKTKYLRSDDCIVLESENYTFLDNDEPELCYSMSFFPDEVLNRLLYKGATPLKNIAPKLPIITSKISCDPDKTSYRDLLEQYIPFINKNIFVLKTEHYLYTGGAHGDFDSSTLNIDRHTGKIITWEDIFGKEKNKLLYDYIVKEVKQIVAFERFDSYSDDDFYNMSTGTSRMEVNVGGITVRFGLYEISGYADGEPSFDIPLEIIKEVIPDEKFAYYFADEEEFEIESCSN